ncbi:MAG: hypothetical protein ACI4SO_07620 [Muribaculaceae bacterium]
MKKFIYSDYIKVAKVGDIIALGGMGIVDGLRNITKSRTYKVVGISDEVYLRQYGKKSCGYIPVKYRSQDCMLLSKREFNELSKY